MRGQKTVFAQSGLALVPAPCSALPVTEKWSQRTWCLQSRVLKTKSTPGQTRSRESAAPLGASWALFSLGE